MTHPQFDRFAVRMEPLRARENKKTIEADHVSPDAPPPAMLVGGEGRAPDALGGGQLGAVTVGGVAYALGGQGVAGVAPFPVLLNQALRTHEAAHHLADPPLGDAEPGCQVFAGDHRMVDDEV